jgi:hypothetical protein
LNQAFDALVLAKDAQLLARLIKLELETNPEDEKIPQFKSGLYQKLGEAFQAADDPRRALYYFEESAKCVKPQ